MLAWDGRTYRKGGDVTVWTVERDARGWSVVAERDGQRQEVRRSLSGLACITARVLAAELNGAYAEGREHARKALALETFGDD